jgi:hypothetical protein
MWPLQLSFVKFDRSLFIKSTAGSQGHPVSIVALLQSHPEEESVHATSNVGQCCPTRFNISKLFDRPPEFSFLRSSYRYVCQTSSLSLSYEPGSAEFSFRRIKGLVTLSDRSCHMKSRHLLCGWAKLENWKKCYVVYANALSRIISLCQFLHIKIFVCFIKQSRLMCMHAYMRAVLAIVSKLGGGWR